MALVRGALWLLLWALWGVSARADVTGSFSISAQLAPQGHQTEAQKMDIDLRANLQLNVTFSGLTLGAEALFGTMGAEEVLLSLDAKLGALSLRDELFFSVPYFLQFPSGLIASVLGQGVHPTVDGLGNPNGLGFVQKKVVAEVNLAGVTLTNTTLFEDVDFPGLLNTASPTYHLDGVDSVVGNQTPTFGFGDVLELSGQTVSGVTVGGALYLCADDFSSPFKSQRVEPTVNRACTAQFGNNVVTPVEGGAKTPLMFERETLSLENLEIGGVRLDAVADFRPNRPFLFTLTSQFAVLDRLNVLAVAVLENLTRIEQAALILTTLELDAFDGDERPVTNGVELLLLDLDGDLQFEQSNALLGVTLNPNQNPAHLLLQAIFIAPNGLSFVFAQLAVERGPLLFEALTVLSEVSPGRLAWDGSAFSLALEPEDGGPVFSVEAIYSGVGISAYAVSFEVDF